MPMSWERSDDEDDRAAHEFLRKAVDVPADGMTATDVHADAAPGILPYDHYGFSVSQFIHEPHPLMFASA